MSGFHLIPFEMRWHQYFKEPETEPNVRAAIERDPCRETNFDGGANHQGLNCVLNVENLVQYICMNEGCVDAQELLYLGLYRIARYSSLRALPNPFAD